MKASDYSELMPVEVFVGGCGDLVEVRVASSAPRAHGTLVIDTNHPADPHWQTRVEFSPQ